MWLGLVFGFGCLSRPPLATSSPLSPESLQTLALSERRADRWGVRNRKKQHVVDLAPVFGFHGCFFHTLPIAPLTPEQLGRLRSCMMTG